MIKLNDLPFLYDEIRLRMQELEKSLQQFSIRVNFLQQNQSLVYQNNTQMQQHLNNIKQIVEELQSYKNEIDADYQSLIKLKEFLEEINEDAQNDAFLFAKQSFQYIQDKSYEVEQLILGEQHGVPIEDSDSPYYHNNAKYYYEEIKRMYNELKNTAQQGGDNTV